MEKLRKNIAILLAIVMVFSLITITGVTATATDDVTVTVTSQQGVFENVSKNYKKNDVFELAVMWQNTNLLKEGDIDVCFNNAGIKVVGYEVNPKIKQVTTNIESQEKGGVFMNFTMSGVKPFGIDYSTADYIIKYKVQVLDNANSQETLTVDFVTMSGMPENELLTWIYYIDDNMVVEENKDQFTASVTLGDGVQAPTTEPTDESESSNTSSTNPTDTTDPTDSTGPTEPNDEKPEVKPTIKATKKVLKAGESTKVTVKNATGKVTYTSSKPKVATVSSTGVVKALGTGSTKITAKIKGYGNISCTIRVETSPKLYNGKKVVKNNQTIKITKGKSVTLSVKGKASGVNNKYTTSNKKIAKVTSKNNATKIKIKAYKKGDAKITVKINKHYKTTIKIKVK